MSPGTETYWAHVIWQRHHLPIEKFDAMPRKQKLFYIASECVELEHPVRQDSHWRRKGGS